MMRLAQIHKRCFLLCDQPTNMKETLFYVPGAIRSHKVSFPYSVACCKVSSRYGEIKTDVMAFKWLSGF